MAIIDNLVAYWKLDETSGTNINDEVGTNDGTIQGNVTVNQTGKLGKCVLIDANTEYISLASTITYGSSVSYAFWIYPTSRADDRLILSFGNGYQSRIFLTATNGYVRVETNTNGQEFYFATAPSLNAWSHVVLTRSANGAGIKYYLNGSYIDEATVTTPADLSINQIGCNDRSFVGNIDEVGIWNRILSSTEVTELYNNGDGLPYPFATYGGVLYMYNGSIWTPRPLAVQNGGMTVRPVRFWDGTSWKLTQSF